MSIFTEIIQTNIISFIGLIIVSYFLTINPLFDQKSKKIFFLIILVNISMLIVTSIDSSIALHFGPDFYILRRITSFLNFACGPLLPLLLWRIFYEKKLPIYAYIPMILNVIVCFISIFYNLVFFINSSNHYDRGPLFMISILISWFYMIMLIRQPIHHKHYKKHAEHIFLFVVIFLMFLSFILEVVFHLRFMNWNFSAMSLILYYLLLNIQYYMTDSLTGAYNRGCYDNELHKIEYKTNYIITLLDLNKFKLINDTYGHMVGDDCLILITNLFIENLPANSRLYRIGGDEFVVLSKKADYSSISKIIETIHTKANDYGLNFAYGIVDYHITESLTDAIKKADSLMYVDKKRKQDCYFPSDKLLNLHHIKTSQS
ncbi:MAG: GGDEF domain-containing protein [Anaerorhabdus sp.]